MNKEFIPYEQALELKELGFDEPCLATYHKELYTIIPIYAEYTSQDVIKAPLYQQAFRWFRDKHDWIGGVRLLSHESISGLLGEFTKDKDNNFMMFGATYEEVELKCLKELIEIFKNK